MRCPLCGDLRDRVVDSRQADDGGSIRRRRQCESCSHRYTTFERVEAVPLLIRKRDASREEFDASKAMAGVAAACKARPVAPAEIEQLVGRVEDAVRAMGPEVTSDTIGREILAKLRHVDAVAAIRFASVYKSFEHVDDFERELSLLHQAEE